MKHLKYILSGIFATLLTIVCYAKSTTAIAEHYSSLAPMLQKVMPTIVNISVRGEVSLANISPRRSTSKLNPRFEDLGSGVIIDAENGYIVTNAHVIKDAQAITITLNDGRSLKAKIIGLDTVSDLAVLKITAKRLKSVTFGDSDKLKVGDFVCAIGSPYGLQQTVTSGVVSGLERKVPNVEGFENFIQTDASINPGSSGGALVNMKGELVGINTAIISLLPISSGIGLAIPSNTTKNVTEQLIKYGKVKRGIMGATLQDVTPALAEAMNLQNLEKGALVAEIIPKSPAEKAGLRSKDVIVKINGRSVYSATQARNIVTLLPIYSNVYLQIRRGDKTINIKVTIADREELGKIMQETPKTLLSGLILTSFNHLVNNQYIKGIEVLYVDDDSVAYSCGLVPGDIILTAANQSVTTINELQTIANKNPTQLLLEIKRGLSGNAFLVLEE